MKKFLAAVTAALAALSFSAVIFAAEPTQTMPPGHPPIGDQSAKPAKPAKKTKKAKKAKKPEKTEEKKEESKPAETPATK